MELFFKMQFVKNVLVYVFRIFTFSFCYCFYEGFTHKIILVSQFLPFICISHLLKVFKFDIKILHDPSVVTLLKSLSRLPQGMVLLCRILFLMFACNNFPLRLFVTMIYWILLFPWIQLCLLWTLSKSMFFEHLVLIPLVLYLIRSVLAEVSLNCNLEFNLGVSSSTLVESTYGLWI